MFKKNAFLVREGFPNSIIYQLAQSPSSGDWQRGKKHSWTLPGFRLHSGQVGCRQGLVSNISTRRRPLKDTLPHSYGSSAFSFSGIMKNAMKDRNTDFHLEEASLELPNFLPCCLATSVLLLSLSIPKKTLPALPVLNLTH